MSQALSSQYQSGGVLTEFVIVIPMLLVFFMGILGAGQMLGQLSWLSQATYIGAVSGSSSSSVTVVDTIKNNIEKFRDLQGDQLNQNSGWQVHSTFSQGALSGKPIVTVDVTAKISPLMSSFLPTNMGVSAATAYLVPNASQFAGLNSFANPSGLTGCPIGGCPPPKNPPPKWYNGGYSSLKEGESAFLDWLVSAGISKDFETYSGIYNKYTELMNAEAGGKEIDWSQYGNEFSVVMEWNKILTKTSSKETKTTEEKLSDFDSKDDGLGEDIIVDLKK